MASKVVGKIASKILQGFLVALTEYEIGQIMNEKKEIVQIIQPTTKPIQSEKNDWFE